MANGPQPRDVNIAGLIPLRRSLQVLTSWGWWLERQVQMATEST